VRTPFVRSFCLSILTLVWPVAIAVAGPVTGRVLDPAGTAVPGANVIVLGRASIVATTITDTRGVFAVTVPDEGLFEVRVALEGFDAQPVRVEGTSGTRDIGDVNLHVSAVSESVVVSGAHVEIPLSHATSSITVVTGDELAARQIETMADVLRTVPGLTVVGTGGRGSVTSVFPRGGESDYTLVFVDGIQTNAFGGGFDFAHLPAVNIDRIEIVRGPQSALYGSNAIGAVVRIVTRKDGPPSAEGMVEAGSFGTRRLTAATAGNRGEWNWGASAERLESDGMNGRRSDAGQMIVNDDYGRHSAQLAGAWRRSDRGGLRGELSYGYDERGFPGPFGSNPAGFFDGIDSVSRGKNERWLASLAGTARAGARVRIGAHVGYGRFTGTFDSPFGVSDSFSRRVTTRLQSDIDLTPALALSAGAELQRERAGSTFITAAGTARVPVDRQVLAYFAEARWNRGGTLFVTAGTRIDDIRRDALAADPDAFVPRPAFPPDAATSVNPKISAAWYMRRRAGDFTKLRASAGTGIRPPDGLEIAFTDNPSLKPERSRSVEVGLDHALAGGRGLIEVTGFSSEYDDLIVAVGSFNSSSRYHTDNISNARARGIEISGTARTRFEATVPVDLQLRGSYTWLDTEILAVDRTDAAPPPFAVGDHLLRRPQHQFSVDATARAGRLTACAQGGGRGRALDVEPSLGTFGGLFQSAGYVVWRAGAAWRLRRGLELFGRVDNIFNRTYEESLGFPALGRGAMTGVRIAAGR
jgi:outer membrane cobalamin receptor